MKHNTPDAMASNLLRAGWEPLPSEVWHEVAEHLPQPWTEGQAAHDLRVHASEVRLKKRLRFSGRVYFRKRWGWPDRRVRSLLKAEQVWKDPRFAGERTTSVPAAYHSRTTPSLETQVEPSAAYQPRTTPVPPASTRADLHSTQITDHKNNSEASDDVRGPTRMAGGCLFAGLPRTGERPAAPEAEDAGVAPRQAGDVAGVPTDLRGGGSSTPASGAARVWEQVNDLRRASGERAWKLNDSRRTAIKARIKESSEEDVLTVFRWFINSPDAKWNRDNWKTPADTLLRAKNFLGYLERAQSAGAPLTLLGGASTAITGANVWATIEKSYTRSESRHTPGIRDHWRLYPDDDRVDPMVLTVLQELTETSSVGFAWRALRMLNDWDRKQLRRKFIKAFDARWRLEVAA